MSEEPIVKEVNRPFIVRVSGEYQTPNEGFIKKQQAQARLRQIIPDYENMNTWEKRRAKERRGIITCPKCYYPQKIENYVCCFCETDLD